MYLEKILNLNIDNTLKFLHCLMIQDSEKIIYNNSNSKHQKEENRN